MPNDEPAITRVKTRSIHRSNSYQINVHLPAPCPPTTSAEPASSPGETIHIFDEDRGDPAVVLIAYHFQMTGQIASEARSVAVPALPRERRANAHIWGTATLELIFGGWIRFVFLLPKRVSEHFPNLASCHIFAIEDDVGDVGERAMHFLFEQPDRRTRKINHKCP